MSKLHCRSSHMNGAIVIREVHSQGWDRQGTSAGGGEALNQGKGKENSGLFVPLGAEISLMKGY